ncbi:MAG: NAD-dependent epimerase/dehydratase family protein [Phycisphaerales bacterium]|nr:NAD-dependent epimerase/dehydratase family protein [Phycisphaerales bacterium]
MRVLYIGGSGEISYACIHEGARLGHDISVFNRGHSTESYPQGVRFIQGDMNDPASYGKLGEEKWDVVCQFRIFNETQARRDIDMFAGKVGQYVFISTASGYQKPSRQLIVTENTPMENPFWPYSQAKIVCEKLFMGEHQAGRLPVTIVRPSHTHRRNFPGTIGGSDHWAWRMLQGKSILVHGDGTSLWTITYADDFAVPFARLLGNAKALGQAFHITRHMESFTWNDIFMAMGKSLGVEPRLVHVPTAALVRFKAEWAGPLYGDKTPCVMFDNTKVMQATGLVDWKCKLSLQEGMNRVVEHYRQREAGYKPDEELHTLIDRVTEAQMGVGA